MYVKSENILWWLVLFFHHVDPGYQTWVIKVDSKRLSYELSH